MTGVLKQGTTNSRSEVLAAQVEQINGDLLTVVQMCSPEQWRRTTAGEQWPVAVVAHHVADVSAFFAGLFGSVADDTAGKDLISLDGVDENNARHAAEFANVGQAEVVNALQSSGPALVAQIKRLRDDQLDQALAGAGVQTLTTGQMVELGVIGHFNEHLASIRAAIGDHG